MGSLRSVIVVIYNRKNSLIRHSPFDNHHSLTPPAIPDGFYRLRKARQGYPQRPIVLPHDDNPIRNFQVNIFRPFYSLNKYTSGSSNSRLPDGIHPRCQVSPGTSAYDLQAGKYRRLFSDSTETRKLGKFFRRINTWLQLNQQRPR